MPVEPPQRGSLANSLNATRSARSEATHLARRCSPGQNGRLILVARNPGLDVGLISSNNLGVGIEVVVICRVEDLESSIVSPTSTTEANSCLHLRDVNVHATIVRPIVGKSDDKLQAMSLG